MLQEVLGIFVAHRSGRSIAVESDRSGRLHVDISDTHPITLPKTEISILFGFTSRRKIFFGSESVSMGNMQNMPNLL
jgi:hypothetical protein